MIVRDEEANLEACLAPVAALFDEIVIVDTGSVDATREIARRFTPHVHDFPWCDDFSAARNESLRLASGDWVFWLDADDRIRPENVERLRGIIEQLDDRRRVMMMDTVLLPPGPNDEPEVVTHARLFRRHDELRWRGRVHEQLLHDFSALSYEWVFTEVQIEHTGYVNRALAARKERRKQRLLRMDYAVNPNDPSTLFHLGVSLRCTGHAEEAHTHLRRLVESASGNANYTRWAYEGLVRLSLAAGKPQEALGYAARGLSLFPGDGPLLFSQATTLYSLEDYHATASTLQQLIADRERRMPQYSTPIHLRTKLAPRMLGTVRRLEGAFGTAEAILRGVLREFPTDHTTWYDLGLVYLDICQPAALQSVVHELQGLPNGKSCAGLLVALWHLRRGDPSQAGPIIDDLIALEPQATRPRMLRAEWLSRMEAPLDDQLHALRDILRIEPGNIETQRWIELTEQAKRARQATLQPAIAECLTPALAMPSVAAG